MGGGGQLGPSGRAEVGNKARSSGGELSLEVPVEVEKATRSRALPPAQGHRCQVPVGTL